MEGRTIVTISYAPPIGGGQAYGNKITQDQADTVVRSSGELISAMGSATSGEIIFIPGDAEIDMTGQKEIDFGASNVTLASNRGVNGSPGGLIYTNDKETANVDPLINSSNDNMRVTGLRMRGDTPDEVLTPPHDSEHSYATNGIGIREGGSNWEIDNCEFWGWTGQALNIWADGVFIHHNVFHHNQMRHLGYGMELQYGHHYVMCNIFYKNRHSIAAVGRDGNGYTARHNIFGTTNNEYGHAIDAHGYPSSGDQAGTTYLIENNTVMRRYGGDAYSSDEQVHFTGVPSDHATVRNNWFRHPTRPSGVGGLREAWWQSSVGSSLQNMTFENNHYGLDSEPPQGVGAARGSATIEFED